MPRTQVVISRPTTAAEHQRDVAAVEELARGWRPRKISSTTTSGATTAAAAGDGQRQTWRNTTKASSEVITMVPVTAMP